MYQFQVGSKQFFFRKYKMYTYDVSLTKTVTKLCTILTKCFFLHVRTLQATFILFPVKAL